mgnify:CR=1 FL=1
MATRPTKKPAKPRARPAAGTGPPAATLDVLTPAQAAAYLQVSEEAVRAEAEAGHLPGRRIGGDWRFSRPALLGWLAAAAPTLADWFRDHPPPPWTPEREREVEAEIAELAAFRKSLGTVGDVPPEEEAA